MGNNKYHVCFQKKKKKNSSLIIIGAAAFLLLIGLVVGFLLIRKGSKSNHENNLGQQQRQQTNNAVLQLANYLLGNTNNLDQLTKKPDGAVKTIQEIEEEFLISAFNHDQSNINIGRTLPPEVIERIWWELRPWIEEYLRDLNRPILEHAREKFRRDIENWIRWQQQKEYNQQLEEYWRRLQELKRIEELIAEYQKIRERELLDKISRKTELIGKGYVDKDIEKLKEWNLLDQEIPDLNAEKRIGATNILYTQGQGSNKIGGSCDLIIFLKPKSTSSEIIVDFTIDLGEYKDYYSQIIRSFLTEKDKVNHDVYVLVRTLNSARGDSAGIAFYLTLHSLINQIPLPRNLGSTGTVYGTRTGAIGGLNLKLEHNVKKEKPINIFILSEENKNNEWRLDKGGQKVRHKYPQWDAYENIDFSPLYKEKVEQIHFINSTNQIEITLQEILKEPSRKIIHSCSKDKIPDQKPEKPTNSKITSEQLLGLVTELSIRENGDLGEHQVFWEKLKNTVISEKTHNYEMAVWGVAKGSFSLHKEYLEKLEKIQTNPQRNENQGEIEQLQREIFYLKEQIRQLRALNNREDEINQLVKQIEKKKQEIKTLSENDIPHSPEENIEKKKQICQEYENKFQKIASSVSGLTNEILTNLVNLGYSITEIKWTSELKAPSLTTEPAVRFSYTKIEN